jgi:hypothetical protein
VPSIIHPQPRIISLRLQLRGSSYTLTIISFSDEIALKRASTSASGAATRGLSSASIELSRMRSRVRMLSSLSVTLPRQMWQRKLAFCQSSSSTCGCIRYESLCSLVDRLYHHSLQRVRSLVYPCPGISFTSSSFAFSTFLSDLD